ncbi:hypothetical protein [Pseudomonas juntendi]|jgi:hypothetical protein|uniref:hypothetical protein n=1 Tax=Pseudomonas TaxID=286 RepID=UPI001F21E510|nr:hypothetical protein [Pseudomonas juntendi]MCO7058304.1 hypothetical protein [Pseudomonas juntendi]UJM15194.1 hypothetical protein L1P09_26035 [Pseudomonas juntendi]
MTAPAPFPLSLKPGDRAHYQPGVFGTQTGGKPVLIAEVGRQYIRDTMGRQFQIADGINTKGAAQGRLWASEAAYKSEIRCALAIVRLTKRLEGIARTTRGSRPSLENVLAAASLLGVNPEHILQ